MPCLVMGRLPWILLLAWVIMELNMLMLNLVTPRRLQIPAPPFPAITLTTSWGLRRRQILELIIYGFENWVSGCSILLVNHYPTL